MVQDGDPLPVDPQFLNLPSGDPDWRAVMRNGLKARRNGQNVTEVAL